MGKKKSPKIVIMKPTHRQGAWRYGKDVRGFTVKVPVGIRGEDQGNGWRKYKI